MPYSSPLLVTMTLCCSLFVVGGCASYTDLPAGTVRQIDSSKSAIVEQQAVSVAAPVDETPAAEYRIGANDVLFVNVNGRPDLQAVPLTGTGRIQGSRVDGTGNLNLPLVGKVQVAGLTISEAVGRLKESYRTYLKDPWVVVEVAEYRSTPLYLLGQFRSPGTSYMDRPLTLLQGISLGGGFDSAANLRAARLSRDGKVVPVDIYNLLNGTTQQGNIWLKGGDTIYIPDNRSQQVFVFGAVKKPGPVPLPNGGLTLAQAIASAELRDTGFNHRQVRIIRSFSTTRGELLVVDFEQILRGEALPLPLMDGDVVFLPKSSIGNWNDALAEMLPSLQAVSAILNPFVQVKFLSK